MKKSLLTAALLGIGAAICMIVGLGMVSSKRNSITVTEQVLAGDRAFADGITFQIGTQWRNKLFWLTGVTLDSGQNRVQTVSAFGKQPVSTVKEGTQEQTGNILKVYTRGDMQMSTESSEGLGEAFYAYSSFGKAISDAADRTAPGEQHTEKVRLSDYYEYYPLEMALEKETGKYVSGNALPFISEFFGLRVSDSHILQITTYKNEEGVLMEAGCRTKEGGIQIECCSVASKNGIWFTVSVRQEDGKLAGLKRSSGNGIYFLPVEEEEPDYENMEMVFPLTGEEQAVNLQQDSKGEKLFLISDTNGRKRLRVIDPGTGEACADIELPFSEEELYVQMELLEDNILLMTENGSFCLVTPDGAGGYESRIAGKLGEAFSQVKDADLAAKLKPAEHVNQENNILSREYAAAYQDGRLALLLPVRSSFYCSVCLYVYGEDGLGYLGYYHHSGDNREKEANILDSVLLWQSDALAVRFYE